MVRWIMIDEVKKDLEGSSLIEILSQNLPRGTLENHRRTSVRIAVVPVGIRRAHFPNACLDHYW
jgi:hypothetical protein